MPCVRLPTRNNPFSIRNPLLNHHSSNARKTLTMSVSHTNSKRSTCPSCSKPTRLCLCTRIRNLGLENKVGVTILQHNMERKHPLNSARIAKLGLKNVTVVTVCDVLFSAQFVIRLLEPGLGSNGVESLDRKETQECYFEAVGGFSLEHPKEEKINVGDNDPIGLESLDLDGVSKEENSILGIGMEEPVITATIGKHGEINYLNSKWKVEEQKRPNFDQILGSKAAVDALAKGFIVKKVQTLSKCQEFELVVPAGSVLLFPSDKALVVDDDVQEMKGFGVRNLIVLDGTWSKAKRMYKENPWLRLLPHLKLDLDKLSLFSEVRRQPKAVCLSTIESIVYALKAVGDNPKQELDCLLDVLQSMVEDQRRCKDERLNSTKAPPT